MTNKKKLLLIDGSSVAYRAFFALYNQIERFKNPAGASYQCDLWFPSDAGSHDKAGRADPYFGSL